jgi:two-component system NarL family sensor kinase
MSPARVGGTDSRSPGVDHLWLATLRAALVPVVALGEQLVDSPRPHDDAFPIVLGAFALWAAGVLALRALDARGRVQAPAGLDRLEPFVDLAAITALTYTSGGPFSETAMAFFVLPVLAAARLRPTLTAGWALGAIAAFVLLCAVHPSAGEDEATGRVVSQVAYLALVGAAATLVSYVLSQRDAAIGRLAEQRGRLASHALTAEERERRRLAELLHDEAVQTLSLARQELTDFHRTGREDAFGRARAAIDETMAQLRGEIFELHPYVLDHAGLEAALGAMAERSAERTGAEVRVLVDPAAAGVHDELVVLLARELIANVVKHSRATHVAVSVACDSEQLELQVRDDGRGFDAAARRAAALRDGHIGLASSEERVRAAGGALVVASRPGAGTTVRVTLPLAAAPAEPPAVPEEHDAPGLLLVFFAATALMVGAVMLVLWTDSPWVDAGAVALLLALLGLVVDVTLRALRDGDDRMTSGRSA